MTRATLFPYASHLNLYRSANYYSIFVVFACSRWFSSTSYEEEFEVDTEQHHSLSDQSFLSFLSCTFFILISSSFLLFHLVFHHWTADFFRKFMFSHLLGVNDEILLVMRQRKVIAICYLSRILRGE